MVVNLRRLILAVVAALAIPGCLAAATFVVDSPLDSHDYLPGDGIAADHPDSDSAVVTLRAALEEADALAGPDTVLVPVGIGTIELTLGQLTISDNATRLSGAGGYPVLDGIGNPLNHPVLRIMSDSNEIGGLKIRRSRGDAIVVTGSDNRVGGTTVTERVYLVDNGLDNPDAAAVRISGIAATGNIVTGSFIGVAEGGMTPGPNRHGVIIEDGASGNLIGSRDRGRDNLISGNEGYGVLLTGQVFDNQVAGNWIGPDSSGRSGPGNGYGGILVTAGAYENTVGGDSLTQGNLISANLGEGVVLSGADVEQNIVNGNMIGCDSTGYGFLANARDGVLIVEGAHNNLIGGATSYSGNLISGNAECGVRLAGEGVSENILSGNWIGIGFSGSHYLGNGWISGDGVRIEDGASDNTLGGTTLAEKNVCSANYGYGVLLRGEMTTGNQVLGNYIGLNASGTSSLGNTVGVVIADGAQQNIIGGPSEEYRNVISSNRGGDFPYGVGVLIYGDGTAYNQVSANIIGLNAAGNTARGNLYAGVVLASGAHHNTIGGDQLTDGNIISGNGLYEPNLGRAAGIHIFGTATDFNVIRGNLIGVDAGGNTTIGNGGHGIGLYSGASDNIIGGDSYLHANRIEANDRAGIYLDGSETRANVIRRNSLDANTGLGIELAHDAQDNIYPPVLTTVGLLTSPGARLVGGNGAPPSATIDIYEVYEADPSGAGEGAIYLASTVANSNGIFEFYLPYSQARPITLTATALDAAGNTSEFAANKSSSDVTLVETDPDILPLTFGLAQNYPNPFNLATRLSFDLPRRSTVTLDIFNSLGQQVTRLVEEPLPPGRHTVEWYGRNARGEVVASGIYFYRLLTENERATRKMILLK